MPMLPVIQSEFRKLTTVRSPWLLLAAGPLIVIAGVTGLVESGGNLHDPAVQSTALAHVGLAALFTLIFGILAVAGEYRHGTVTDTYLSFPKRGRVLTAKLAICALIGAAAGLVSSLVALAATAAWWAAKGGAFHLSAAGTWRTVGGLARWLPFYASQALDRANMSATTRLLPQWEGGLVLLGYATAFAAAAMITTLKRDVT